MSRSKSKRFLSNMMQNTIAFGIYMLGYHLLMLPYMAKHLTVEENARLLLFIMVSSILTLSLGNELGVLYQVLKGRPGEESSPQNVRLMHFQSNALLALLTAVILALLRFTPLEILILTAVMLVMNIRLFYLAYLRFHDKYIHIAIGNSLYVAGVLLAIVIFQFTPIIFWLPLLLSESISLIYFLIVSRDFLRYPVKRAERYRVHGKEYMNLVSSALLSNIPTYSDKLLILPILGQLAMSAYYAGTAFSKVLYLLINPINGVLLAWLAKDRKSDPKTVLRRQLKISFGIVLVVCGLSLPVVYVMTRIFYPQFFDIVRHILLPLSISAAFGISAGILRIVFLRYLDLAKLKYINLIHIAVFLLSSLLGARWGGLGGFAYGVAASKAVLWGIYVYALLAYMKHQPDNGPAVIHDEGSEHLEG